MVKRFLLGTSFVWHLSHWYRHFHLWINRISHFEQRCSVVGLAEVFDGVKQELRSCMMLLAILVNCLIIILFHLSNFLLLPHIPKPLQISDIFLLLINASLLCLARILLPSDILSLKISLLIPNDDVLRLDFQNRFHCVVILMTFIYKYYRCIYSY